MTSQNKTRRMIGGVFGGVGILVLAGSAVARVQVTRKQGATSKDTQAAAMTAAKTSSQSASANQPSGVGVIRRRVRDTETGYSVRGALMVEGAEEGQYGRRSFSTDEYGRLRLQLPQGYYFYEASARGYKPLRSYFQ